MSGAILHRYSCTITAPDVVALFVYMLCDIRFQEKSSVAIMIPPINGRVLGSKIVVYSNVREFELENFH